MSQVVTAVLLIFSGVTLISAQPFFGAPGFDGFPRGPFGDFGPRTIGAGGDFGPPTVRRLGGRFPDFGGAVRGGGPLLGTIDGPRFGFNGDNTLGLDRVTGPRLDGLRGGRFGFDDTTFGTGFGRRVGGVGARRFIPGERLGGTFGAGNAIAPRRLGTTRTITRGNALDVPRSTVLDGLGTDATGLFIDPVTRRRVRVLTNNDANTVVSRRAAAAAAGGPTRTGSLTPRRADGTVTATRTRLPTTLTQRGTLLRRQMAGGRRTPVTRIAGTTMTRPGTLTGAAGTGPSQQLRTLPTRVMGSNMSPSGPLVPNMAMASSLVNRQGAVASVPLFNNIIQQQSVQTARSPLTLSANVRRTNTFPRLTQVPRQQTTPVASISPSPTVTSQASRSISRRHTTTVQRPLYQQLNWLKLHQYMSRVIQFQQNQQQKALKEHAQRQLREQSAKDEELMKRIKLLTDHIKRLEKQQHEHLEVIRQQEEIKLRQKQNHEKQQREWQIMLQNLIDTLQSPHQKHRNNTLMKTKAPLVPTHLTTVQGGVPIFQPEDTPPGGLSSLLAGTSQMSSSVVSTQVGTISNSATVDVSSSSSSTDGVPLSGLTSDQSGQGGTGNVKSEFVSLLPGSNPLLDMQKGSLQSYLQVNQDQRLQLQGTDPQMVEENLEKLLLTYLNNIEYNSSSQVAALLAPSLLGINSTKGANLDMLLPLNDTVVTPSTIHNITSSPLATTLSGDAVIVEGKSFIDWSMFNKILQEEGVVQSNDSTSSSSHPDIVAARTALQDLVEGRASFLDFNQTVVGLGNNAQQGALGSFSQSSAPQDMSMVAGSRMDHDMIGQTSRRRGGAQMTRISNTGARPTTGLSGINSNRLTFDSVDLSAFGTGQSGFVQGVDPTSQLTGLGNGLVLARPPASGVSLGLGRQGVRLPLDEAARRALSVTNRRPSVSQTGMATGRVAGVTRRAIPGTVTNGRGLTGATSRNRVTVIRAGASPVVGSTALRGSAGTGVSGTTVRRTISTQARRMPGTSNLVATRQRGFALDNTARQRQGSGGVTASASDVRRVSTVSRRAPSSGARRQVSRTSSASMTVGTVGGSTNVPANIDLNNVPALDLSMASGSSSSSSASSSSSSTSSASGSSSTTARKTQTLVENNTGVSSGTRGQDTRTTITRTTTVTGPDGSASRDLTSLEKQLIGAADVDRPVFAIIPMNDRANSADLKNIMENIATSMNTMTSTVSPILPSMTDLEASNTIADTTKRSNPPDPLAP